MIRVLTDWHERAGAAHRLCDYDTTLFKTLEHLDHLLQFFGRRAAALAKAAVFAIGHHGSSRRVGWRSARSGHAWAWLHRPYIANNKEYGGCSGQVDEYNGEHPPSQLTPTFYIDLAWFEGNNCV